MPTSRLISLMIVAGERSGDIYGARLAAAMKTRLPDLEVFGCGGEAMRSAGAETVVDLREFAMVGITEVISGLPGAYRALRSLVRAAEQRRPRLAVLIDSPSLNMRLARRLKRRSIPVVYFVSPQVWAWKKWRLRQLPALVDRMICIFDFEEAIYREAGIPAEYVGHPLVETAAPRLSRDQFCSQFQLDPTLTTVALLPGSRQIELQYILPTLLDAARQLSATRQDLQFVLAAAPTLNAARLEARLRDRLGARRPVRVITNATYDALAYSTIAVVASGTATVEAAILGCPMVVVYRVAPLTAFFARRMVDVPFFSMVNLLAGKKVVEELIQDDFTATRLAAAVTRLLDHPELQSKMKEELLAVKSRLGAPGAIERAADSILEMLQPAEERREAGAAAPELLENKGRPNTTA